MRLIRSLRSPHLPAACALTVGNFDAMHIGHRRILGALKREARAMNLPLAVMTFAPGPAAFFLGARAPVQLCNLSARYFNLLDAGADFVLSLRFNRALAETSAEDFIREVLVKKLKVKLIWVGDDFRFGKDRRGDFAMLKKFAQQFNFRARAHDEVALGDLRVSSTRVRAALAGGDLRAATAMLGREYAVVGRVAHGNRLGRTWGFPTLNLPTSQNPPMQGVFAVRISGLADADLPGAASWGTRPNVGGSRVLLEAHVFNFNREVYARRVCVKFVAKIRDEKKFASINLLRAQIKKDAEIARKILAE